MSAERIKFLKTIDYDHKRDWSEYKKEIRWFVNQLKEQDKFVWLSLAPKKLEEWAEKSKEEWLSHVVSLDKPKYHKAILTENL
tara:strand:- start:179 stop:427 length:249 start_codon:yes stop_codon:yes gene_type:complete